MPVRYSTRETVFGSNLYVGEDWARQRLVEWINEIIREEKLSSFYRADVQVRIKGKYPDIIVFDKKEMPFCLLELKRPEYPLSAFISDAQSKAVMSRPQIQYFATWNVKNLELWKTYDPEALRDEDLRVKPYHHIVDIEHISEIRKPEVEAKIKEFLKVFLRDLERIYCKVEVLPLKAVDEFFIDGLRRIVDMFAPPIYLDIKRTYKRNITFKKELDKWFVEQGWTAPSSDEDFEKTARQFLYLLIDKTLFYNTLRIKYKGLNPIEISENVKDGTTLKKELQKYFDEAEKATGDYETIFAANFIEKIPVPDISVANFAYFINGFSKYDFSKLGFKDIGRIFDRLIPDNERHKLGQYFTRADVVDLINGFCIRDDDQIVADFGCGAGTFLVRGYGRLKTLNPRKKHGDLLKQLYGVDISKFPAHLSTINLAVRDLSEVENYPKVFCKDFFDIEPGTKVTLFKRTYGIKRLDRTQIEEEFPLVDAVVGNPPYTRQEELEDYIPGYKQKLEKVLKDDWGREGELGGRAGIHAYFFLHGAKFLREKGRFGYITSNSWLDVDYGKYLQEFFLKHHKIVTIVESKVERWFEEADVNTAITILERCYSESKENEKKKEKVRSKNVVKFVQLKVPLAELIPPADKERERWSSIDKLIKFIENTNKFYEDDKIRIFPKNQKELWDEGFDEESKRYVGSKWGKYLRAPDIFFKILDKGKDLFVPLKEVAEVRRGFTTGANEFFYLTEEQIKKWGIEKEFWMHKEGRKWVPNYVIKSPRECKSIIVDPKDLKYRVLMIHKDKKDLRGTNVLKYIQWGEEQGFHKRPTCASRKRWYDLGGRKIPFFTRGLLINDIFVTHYNTFAFVNDVLLEPLELDKNIGKLICILMNSTLEFLLLECMGRVGLGEGALKLQVYEYGALPITNPFKLTKSQIRKLEKSFERLSQRPISSVFEEIGANTPEEVSLDKVKPDRRELDKISMGEILGLSEKEQLEVYKAVIDRVRSRIEKARSVERRKKARGPDPERLAEGILREIDTSKLKKFPDDYIGDCEYGVIKVPEGAPEIGSDLHGFFVRIGGERVECSSSKEAEYIQYAVMNGFTKVKIPKDKGVLKKSVKEYKKAYRELEKEIHQHLERVVPDRKLRKNVESLVLKKLNK